MTEQFTPTMEEVLGMLGAYLYEYGAGCDMNLPDSSMTHFTRSNI